MEGIGWAVKQMHHGAAVARAGWNGKGMWLKLQAADRHRQAFIYMKTVQGTLVPWLASQTDVLATDWELYQGVGALAGEGDNIVWGT